MCSIIAACDFRTKWASPVAKTSSRIRMSGVWNSEVVYHWTMAKGLYLTKISIDFGTMVQW